MNFFRRFIAAALCAAMLIGLAAHPDSPISTQAEAVGPAILPIAALAAFVTAAGINWHTSASADQVPGLIQQLMDEYQADSGVNLVDAATGHLSISALGKIIAAPPLVAAWRKFCDWLQEKKSVAAGQTAEIVHGGQWIGDYQLGTYFVDGITNLSDDFYIQQITHVDSGTQMFSIFYRDRNVFSINSSFATGHMPLRFILPNIDCIAKILPNIPYNSIYASHVKYYNYFNSNHIDIMLTSDFDIGEYGPDYMYGGFASIELSFPSDYYGVDADCIGNILSNIRKSPGLDLVGASAIDVPGQGLADDESVALDVGATAGATADDIAAAIAAAIAAGTFASTATVEAVEPVPGGSGEDIDGLGLPSLAALAITRFPFSIPWDVNAVVSLLSADAQAPYWAVDLMAPLKNRGMKFAGDTTITIDFRDDKWAIIGQVSRWGSLISFCLALAVATKRLIWTA